MSIGSDSDLGPHLSPSATNRSPSAAEKIKVEEDIEAERRDSAEPETEIESSEEPDSPTPGDQVRLRPNLPDTQMMKSKTTRLHKQCMID